MKCCVTGATGFVGQSLVLNLLQNGYEVIAPVRQADMPIIEFCYRHFPDHFRIRKINDLCSVYSWSTILESCDVVIHSAARVHQINECSERVIQEYRAINTELSALIAKMAFNAGVSHMIYLSSIKVYGQDQLSASSIQTPITEQMIPEPDSPYGISKWEAEQELNSLVQRSWQSLTILRPPLVYGKGVKANFAKLVKLVQKGYPLPFAQVDNARSLLFVENLSDAVIKCLKTPKCASDTFMLSDAVSYSLPVLINQISQSLGQGSSPLFPFPVIGLKFLGLLLGRSAQLESLLGNLVIDCKKICSELEWVAPYNLEQGLKDII